MLQLSLFLSLFLSLSLSVSVIVSCTVIDTWWQLDMSWGFRDLKISPIIFFFYNVQKREKDSRVGIKKYFPHIKNTQTGWEFQRGSFLFAAENISVCKAITDHHGGHGNIITTTCNYSHYPQAQWCYMTGLSFQTDVPQGHLSCHLQSPPWLLLHNYCSGQGGSKVRAAAWVGAKWAAKGYIVAYCTSDMSRIQ